MDYLSREKIINELQQSFQPYLDKYEIENIGIFEEEGQDNRYYLGYTTRKAGKTYHVHLPFQKNNEGELAPVDNKWTVESDNPQESDLKEFNNLDHVFSELY
ncbi:MULTISPECIES: DUF5634 family protein [unclassified Fredinandcohnia]|uniref:DUF5634 family protein n=1 Tax=unclassified Fredinandcohnia TaxID=2837514 RepID=UPI0030FD8943